ncbi:MAG: UPF0175 family protein [Candidatus Methanoperedens sp.]|nr:UPF0175 family protein [Candidatus Methanoperedens sp.]
MTTVTVPSTFENEIKALIKAGYYSNAGEFIKDAIRSLFEFKPELKVSLAVELYRSGDVSIGRGAEIAGMNIIQFKEVLFNRGIVREIGSESADELEERTLKLKKITKRS